MRTQVNRAFLGLIVVVLLLVALPVLVAWQAPPTSQPAVLDPNVPPPIAPPTAPARLWLMTYIAHDPHVGYVQQEHDAWRRAQGHVAGVIVQTYQWCAKDVMAQSRAAFPEMTFAPGLAVDTWLHARGTPIETQDWRNWTGWKQLAADITAIGGDHVFLDFEKLLSVPVADLRVVRAAFEQLPTNGITYWVYPAWGEDDAWYKVAGEVLGAHAVGVGGSWCDRISYRYGGADAAAARLARPRDAFGGRIAAIAYSLDGRKNDWTASEVWGLCRTTTADGVLDVIWLPDHGRLQVDQLALCDMLEQVRLTLQGVTASAQTASAAAAAQATQVESVLHEKTKTP